jgi:hypothetical protein
VTLAPASAELLVQELAAASSYLQQRRVAEAAGALDRAARVCGALDAAGTPVAPALQARARELHGQCEVLVEQSKSQLQEALRNAGHSRAALRSYVRGSR